MSEIIWLKNGRIYKQVEDSITTESCLPKGVYNLCFNPNTQELYLEEFAKEFIFPYKVYGLRDKDLNHIYKTYQNTDGNLGVLCNGYKGSSKTVFCKRLANMLDLPVILINAPYPGLDDFLGKINCPITIFFDEFEKNFCTDRGKDKVLLSIMDGVFNSEARKIFLLTTNSLNVNENFLSRPSRIRYHLEFGNLPQEVIREYCDDNLKYPEYFTDLCHYINSLTISTIDILKTVVEEINIHNMPISEMKEIVNIDAHQFEYGCNSWWGAQPTDEDIEEFLRKCNLPYDNPQRIGQQTFIFDYPFEEMEVGDETQYGMIYQVDPKKNLMVLIDRDGDYRYLRKNMEYSTNIYKNAF